MVTMSKKNHWLSLRNSKIFFGLSFEEKTLGFHEYCIVDILPGSYPNSICFVGAYNVTNHHLNKLINQGVVFINSLEINLYVKQNVIQNNLTVTIEHEHWPFTNPVCLSAGPMSRIKNNMMVQDPSIMITSSNIHAIKSKYFKIA
jgi:hypothetical protein